MKSIGIVGSGAAGLQLGLFLQSQGLAVTIYSDRSPDQIRESRLPSVVVRFDPMRERERTLGVDHWAYPDYGVYGLQMYIGLERPLIWKGSFARPASAVDMRLYQSRLLEDFVARGGSVIVAALQASDLTKLSARHDVMVVASGRGSLAEMFGKDAERSRYSRPQRYIAAGFYRGLALPDSLRLAYAVSPGNGEIVHAPFTTFNGRISSLTIEAIPGGAFESLARMPYDDDPERFEAALIELLAEHAPPIHARLEEREFGLTRSADLLQGEVTPTVRRGYVALGNGKFALGLGDAYITHDPILAQGANTASRCARLLGELLLRNPRVDESFCRDVEHRLWEASRAATEWTNMALAAPAPHFMRLFTAAARNRAIADELANNFGIPERNWEIFRSAEGAACFLGRHDPGLG
jgi:hypothetical protein